MANYCAHTGSRKDRADWQLPADQLRNTAALAAACGAPLGLQAAAHVAGLFHDFGKYDPAFGRLLDGQNVRGEHSTAGAALLYAQSPAGLRPCAEVIGHAILGQHAGLPDRYGADSSMERRLDAFRDPVAPEISAAAGSDFGPFARELAALDAAGLLRFRSVGRRAHGVFRDTESFYAGLEGRQPDRTWPALADLLPDWRRALDTHMAQFDRDGRINRLRADILAHVRRGAAMAPGLFTLTVPTGGGKTLASLGLRWTMPQAMGIAGLSLRFHTRRRGSKLLGDSGLHHAGRSPPSRRRGSKHPDLWPAAPPGQTSFTKARSSRHPLLGKG